MVDISLFNWQFIGNDKIKNMFHTTALHSSTSLLPVLFGGVAIVLHASGRIFQKYRLKAISYRFYLLTFLVTTLTSGFGGASIRKTKAVAGIDPFIVKTHAWTAMTAFLLTLALAFYSYKAIKGAGDEVKSDRKLFLISLGFIFFYIYTVIVAFQIR